MNKESKILKELSECKKKIIGWGAGQTFREILNYLPIEYEYVIERNAKLHGEYQGITICPIERLKNEKPEEVVIFINSIAGQEIQDECSKLGFFNTILGADLVSKHKNKKICAQMMHAIHNKPPFIDSYDKKQVIVMQGPLTEYTDKILAYYSNMYPNVYKILSTWKDSDPNFLQRCSPHVDEVILNDLPTFNGKQNRNYLIKSTYEGMKRAKQRGFEYILKLRTDTIVFGSNILKECYNALNAYDKSVLKTYGLNDRLLIPNSFTRKYLFYHPSDMVMYGQIDDLLKYWSVKYDDRVFDDLQFKWDTAESFPQLAEQMIPTESYFAMNFKQKIKNDYPLNLQGSWDFFKDFFIVKNNSWFGFHCFKYSLISDVQPFLKYTYVIEEEFWEKIYLNNLTQVDYDVDLVKSR